MGVRFVLVQDSRRRWPQLGRGLDLGALGVRRVRACPEPTNHGGGSSAGRSAKGKCSSRQTQTVLAPIRRFLDPPGLEGLLRKQQHPGATPEELQRLAQQHRALTEQLIAAIQLLVWVMTAVRQEAWDLLLLALALQAEDVQLARAHQPPPACSRCRDLRELATGCGAAASSPHFTCNRAARQHEQQQQQQHQQLPSRTRLRFAPLTEHTMADAIGAVSTSAAKQRHQQLHPEEDPAASSYLLHLYHHTRAARTWWGRRGT